MRAQEAYDRASEVLSQRIQTQLRQGRRSCVWIGRAVECLRERAEQEEMAKEAGAFCPAEVVNIVNSRQLTHASIESMKADVENYGSLFRADLRTGLGINDGPYCDNGPPYHLKGDPECDTCS